MYLNRQTTERILMLVFHGHLHEGRPLYIHVGRKLGRVPTDVKRSDGLKRNRTDGRPDRQTDTILTNSEELY